MSSQNHNKPSFKDSRSISGLVFALPNPLLPYQDLQSSVAQGQGFTNTKYFSNKDKKNAQTKAQKLKQRSRSALDFLKQYESEMQTKKNSPLNKLYIGYEKKEMIKDSNKLKDRFLQTIKKYDKKDKHHSSKSPKSKPPNFVILSQNQQNKRLQRLQSSRQLDNKKKQEKKLKKNAEQQEKRILNLPQFQRSKSSFYKPKTIEFNTLKILNKTIFASPSNYQATYYRKKKNIQPLELQIHQANIAEKIDNPYISERKKLFLETRKKFQIQQRKRSYEYIQKKTDLLSPKDIKYCVKKQKIRGKTPIDIRGWDVEEQAFFYNQ